MAWEEGRAVCLDPKKADAKPLTLKGRAGQSARTGGPIQAEGSADRAGRGARFAVHSCDGRGGPRRPAT